MMIPAYNKKRCAAVPFETGIHFRRKTDFSPEEGTAKSYLGFEHEPTSLWLVLGGALRVAIAPLPSMSVSGMLYMDEVWRSNWPNHLANILSFQKLIDQMSVYA
ncbi:hypothetical protein TNCV_4203501 [Trichonephila clavipes]|uniref:Uncharacterized protein n=1 Tax=Trichonephila clavipes TaxID=2585209 RepID=A0A8X6S591_TRICX|nr:hypothetical protein TNCV_4203501 [Trichonephila clavipes]